MDAWVAFGKHCLFCTMTRNHIKGLSHSDDQSERRESERKDDDSRKNRGDDKNNRENALIQDSIDVAFGEEIILGPGSSLVVAKRGGITNQGLIRTSRKRDRVFGLNDSRVDLLGQLVGISNEDGGRLETLRGGDRLKGVSRDKANARSAEFAIGISNATGAVLDSGDGDDKVIARAINANAKNIFGAFNFARFDTGSGEDTFKGEAKNDSSDTEKLFGIYNEGRYKVLPPDGDKTAAEVVAEFDQEDGLIVTGADADYVEGIGDGKAISICGIVNFGVFQLEEGDDTLIGRAIGAASFQNHGISNLGIIETGDGDDVVIGSQVNLGDSANELDAGIYNDGVISTGQGKDVVDALVGGFLSGYTLWRPGLVDLGDDDDVLKGFGAGEFDGGSGVDSLLLGQGVYTVAVDPNGVGTLVKEGSSLTMVIRDFETIGGAAGGLTELVSGVYEIDAQQVLVGS